MQVLWAGLPRRSAVALWIAPAHHALMNRSRVGGFLQNGKDAALLQARAIATHKVRCVGHHRHSSTRVLALEAPDSRSGREAVEHGHLKIHQYEIQTQFARKSHRFGPIGKPAAA